MTQVKVRHFVVKRGKGFWQPTKAMRALGFYSVPCGKDGPDAWATAEQWNDRWDKTRRGEAPRLPWSPRKTYRRIKPRN